jgi:hypothetical protein
MSKRSTGHWSTGEWPEANQMAIIFLYLASLPVASGQLAFLFLYTARQGFSADDRR